MARSRILALVIGLNFALSQDSNNVCKNVNDYFDNIKENSNCWFDSDVNASPEQIAKHYGFLLERHALKTEDKYILTTFRIKSLSGTYGKEVIFLQHGLATDALSFMVNGNKSVAFFLVEQGYDVWLGNYRGSEFSRHEFLSRNNPKFWNFCIHEHGMYDLAANFKYINNETKKQIIYIGHSMGGTGFCIYASMRPEETKRYIRHAVLLAPALYFRTSKGILNRPNVMLFNQIGKLINSAIPVNVIMATNSFEKQAFERFCFSSLEDGYLCISLFDELFGKNENAIIIPMIQRGDFTMFDYGRAENMAKYNSTIPPSYDISKISIPLTWIYGKNDNLVTKSGIVYAFDKFRKRNWDIYELPYGHTIFLFDTNADKTAYPILLKAVSKYTK